MASPFGRGSSLHACGASKGTRDSVEGETSIDAHQSLKLHWFPAMARWLDVYSQTREELHLVIISFLHYLHQFKDYEAVGTVDPTGKGVKTDSAFETVVGGHIAEKNCGLVLKLLEEKGLDCINASTCAA